MARDGGPRPEVDAGELPAAARWVLRWERRLRHGPAPAFLRSDGDPRSASRRALLLVMVLTAGGTLLVLTAPAASTLRWLGAPAATLVYGGAVAALEPGTLARRRLGPWGPAALSWLAGLVVLETFLEGFSRPRPAVTSLEAVLAAGMGLAAWGKARLDHEW